MPTAFDAVVASAPAASMVAALGLAGGGYLEGREGVAACGAIVGVFGLAVERLQSRQIRVRLRRAKAEHRTDLREVTRLLHEMQRDLTVLRGDLDAVRVERDAVRAELTQTQRPAAPEPWFGSEPVAATEPTGVPAVEPVAAVEPVVPAAARAPLSLFLPGQVRSPIATGGIPLLAPGPSLPVRSAAEPRSITGSRPGHPPTTEAETEPLPVLTAELADALVYAAMAEADAAHLTHAHTGYVGEAHLPGSATRSGTLLLADEAPPTPRTLYVVRRGKHVA